jgi:hypothetical protein
MRPMLDRLTLPTRFVPTAPGPAVVFQLDSRSSVRAMTCARSPEPASPAQSNELMEFALTDTTR